MQTHSLNLPSLPAAIALDVIGELYLPTGEMTTNDEGISYPVTTLVPGWHVNTIPAVPEWEAYRITPSAKRRVFAGMEAETCCYVFPSEAEFVSFWDVSR